MSRTEIVHKRHARSGRVRMQLAHSLAPLLAFDRYPARVNPDDISRAEFAAEVCERVLSWMGHLDLGGEAGISWCHRVAEVGLYPGNVRGSTSWRVQGDHNDTICCVEGLDI